MNVISESGCDHQSLDKIKQFLKAREAATPVESYDELQSVIRGEIDLPTALVDYVQREGEEGVDYDGRPVSRLQVKTGKFLIKAEAHLDSFEEDCVTIRSSKRMLPLMRHKGTQLVTLHAGDPRWDQAVVYRPNFDAFMPEISSPEAIDFWASKGEQAVYGDDSGRPTTTTGQMARRAGVEALDTFNGFLNTSVWLVDHLVHGAKI